MIRDRSAAVEVFQQIAREDHRVVAAFLGGSLATSTADRLSDIDAYYVINSRNYRKFHSEVPSLLRKMGPLVFLEEHNNFGFDLVLFIFKNGVNGELGLGTPRKFRIMHAGPYKVLVDKKRTLENVVFPFERPPAGTALRKHVQELLAWYWYWYGVFLKCIKRGHLWSATANLSEMRNKAFTLLKLAHRVRTVEKYESRLPAKLLAKLGGSLPSYRKDSFLASAELLTKFLKKEIKQLLVSTGAKYPEELERTILAKFGRN